jgi:hypothetical protein
MPEFIFPLAAGGVVEETSIEGVDVPTMHYGKDGAWLHRPGPDPVYYDRSGRLLSQGIIQTEHSQMNALVEVFGVGIEAIWPNRTSAADNCSLQISLDNGDTFLAWTGAAWEAQDTDGTFNTVADFNDHCDELEFERPCYLGFRVRVTPSDDVSPLLVSVRAYVEWSYDPHIDMDEFLMERLQAARFPFMVMHRMAALGTRVNPQTEMVKDLSAPVRIFNLTTDPNRNSNLFSAVDAGELVLSGPQAAGSVLEIHLSGTMPIIIARQDEMMTPTTVPSLLLRSKAVKNVPMSNTGMLYDYKRGAETKLTRMRQFSRALERGFDVEVVTAEPRTARLAIEAVRRAFGEADYKSKSTGIQFRVLEESPGDEVPVFAEGIEVMRWQACLYTVHPTPVFTQYAGVESVGIKFGDSRRVFERRTFR